MSDRLFERAVHDWLEDGSDRTPPAAIESVLFAVKTTRQQRDLRIPWRFYPMSSPMRLAAGIAIVAVLGVGALAYFYRGPGIGAEPSRSPSASPVPTSSAPTASPGPTPTVDPLDTARWTTFTSARYGFTVAYPEGWAAIPAVRDFVLATDRTTSDEVASDQFIDEQALGSAQILISAFAAPVPEGTSETNWIDAYHAPAEGDTPGCRQLSEAMVPVVIDGRTGLLGTNCNWLDAFVFDADRVYVFTVWRDDQRAVMDALLSTVQLP
jgi:hypothetical protein